MSGIRTMISIVNGASRQIRRIGSDISGLIENAKRLNGTELIRTNVIDRAKNGVERVRATVDKLKTDIVEAAKKQKEHDDAVKGTNRNANVLVNTMRRLLGIYIGLAGLKKILSISDDVSQTSSRIKLINDGLQTTAELEDKIMKSANRSRAAYSDTAKVISKLGITAKKSFKNNDEMIAFTELVTKSFKVGGASASEQTNGMYQLTQAMASGRLQGDEFRSIIENAPLLAKAIADYTGVGQKGLKKMASDGAISADIIKGAVFNSANEIEQKYKQLPITFADIWNRIKNASIIAFRPFLLKISEIANNEKFSKALNGIVNLLALLGTVLANVINIAVSGASFIYDNWSIIEPIFWAIIGVIALYTVVTTTQSIATTALAIAQWALNSAILACPLFWIIAAILAVIIVIGILIHRTIGFKAAWMIAANVVITIWDSLVIAGHMMANGVCDAWDKMLMGAAIMSTGIRNALTNMKAWGLSIIDAFINKAIDAINTLINAVNKIPGVALPTIQHVNIAANAKIEAHAKTSLRDAILNDFINEKNGDIQKRADQIKRMESEMYAREVKRKADIEKAKIEHQNTKNKKIMDFSPSGFDFSSFASNDALKNIKDNTKGTKDHTGKMKDTLNIAEEDLKYLRDVAQREVIDRTVLRDVNVKIDNSFGDINQNADVDGIIRKIEQRIDEEINSNAEGR